MALGTNRKMHMDAKFGGAGDAWHQSGKGWRLIIKRSAENASPVSRGTLGQLREHLGHPGGSSG
jgi:hypothetical protein